MLIENNNQVTLKVTQIFNSRRKKNDFTQPSYCDIIWPTTLKFFVDKNKGLLK